MNDPIRSPPSASARPTSASPLLSLRDITKSWTPGAPPVLDRVSLIVPKGTAIGISGRNGTGKTTLLRIIAGLLVPDAGEVSLGALTPGRDRIEYRRMVGLLSAGNAGLYARLDVDANLAFWARISLLAKRRQAVAIDEVLERFRLHPLRGRRVDRLSMGQRQRLRLALTFLHDPQLVLLDEPCNSLDEEGIGLVRDSLVQLRRAGGAAIVCSPDSERGRLGLEGDLLMGVGSLGGGAP